MNIFFSHPTFTFGTKTESRCMGIIKQSFEVDEVINPANYGLRDDTSEELKDIDMVVGMAVSNKFTFLVWKQMEFGKKNGAKLCTFFVENKNNVGPLVKGMVGEVKKLDKNESKIFSNEILKEKQESMGTLFFGNWGGRF